MSGRLVPVAVTLVQANAFVAAHHRHHAPDVGHRWSHGAWDTTAGRLVGVAIVGRPKARRIDPRHVVEVTRNCTDGTPNACSFLYGLAARSAQCLGFSAIITYTLDEESGASLRSAGWWGEEEATPGRSWSCSSRPRNTPALGPKTRWLKLLGSFEAVAPGVGDAPPATLEMFAGGAA